MQTTLERPEAPVRHRFDVDDYYRMAEVGILSSKDRVELIEGEIVDKAPVGSVHASATDQLSRLFARAFADGLVYVRVQGPLRLDAYSESEPDLMLLHPRADGYRTGHPTAADVLLLVDVADSSLAYDHGPKLALYARHGVAEVWIVDIVGRAVEILREPEPEGYAERRWLIDGIAELKLVWEFDVDVTALLAQLMTCAGRHKERANCGGYLKIAEAQFNMHDWSF